MPGDDLDKQIAELEGRLAPSGNVPIDSPAYGNVDALKAFLRNTANIGGYYPQMAGAASALTGGKYIEGRDNAIRQMDKDKKEYPSSSMAGRFGSNAITAMAPIGSLKNVEGFLPTVAQAAKGGAMFGAALNPGDKEGELNPLQVPDRAANGIKGGLIAGGTAAAGQAVGGIADWLARHSAGLSPGQASVYASNPKEIKALAKAPELEQQGMLERELDDVSKNMGVRREELEAMLQNQAQGKSVPESAIPTFREQVLKAKTLGNPLPTDLQGNVAVSDVIKGQRQIGPATRWVQTDEGFARATDPNVGKAYGEAKAAIGAVAPEAAATRNSMQEGVEASDLIGSARNRPFTFFGGGKQAASNRQFVDQVAGSSLNQTADKLGAANSIARPRSGIRGELIAPIGRAGLVANQAIGNVAKKAAPYAGKLTLSGLLGKDYKVSTEEPGSIDNEIKRLEQALGKE
jgi:hypothetical protein